ncbi:hypothetical protein EVAR_19706_1 [Eumeta japonica]|uniref:Uncharacterized protein n=1 Tax=Eumeta variegata TaxID=151549 RepID=A0A4C1UQF1_EUMVA|nr:hypothetical protein EVAR_19706_1 [Eumeta japonica]
MPKSRNNWGLGHSSEVNENFLQIYEARFPRPRAPRRAALNKTFNYRIIYRRPLIRGRGWRPPLKKREKKNRIYPLDYKLSRRWIFFTPTQNPRLISRVCLYASIPSKTAITPHLRRSR